MADMATRWRMLAGQTDASGDQRERAGKEGGGAAVKDCGSFLLKDPAVSFRTESISNNAGELNR